LIFSEPDLVNLDEFVLWVFSIFVKREDTSVCWIVFSLPILAIPKPTHSEDRLNHKRSDFLMRLDYPQSIGAFFSTYDALGNVTRKLCCARQRLISLGWISIHPQSSKLESLYDGPFLPWWKTSVLMLQCRLVNVIECRYSPVDPYSCF
jgi:hypothetical protein